MNGMYRTNDPRRAQLIKQHDALAAELEEINKLLKETKPKRKVNLGDPIFYVHTSKLDGTFSLRSFVYERYASQNLKIRTGAYFTSEQQGMQFIDDIRQSIINIRKNEDNN
jgi:hypothetical protein